MTYHQNNCDNCKDTNCLYFSHTEWSGLEPDEETRVVWLFTRFKGCASFKLNYSEPITIKTPIPEMDPEFLEISP
jgi:hypothetical protein